MRDFFVFARRVVRDRGVLVFALGAACVSALNMGAGVLAIMPMIRPIIDEDALSLPDQARAFNADEDLLLPISIPNGIIERLPEGRFEGVVAMVIVLITLTLFGAATNFLHQALSIKVATRSIANARADLFRRALAMPSLFVAGRGATEFTARIIRDTAELQRGLIAVMSKAVTQSLQAIVLFAVALLIGRSITIAALVVVPILAIFLRFVGKRIRRGTRDALKGQEDLLRIATEAVQGLRVVKANRAEDTVLARFDASNQRVVREVLRAQLTRAFSSPVTEALAILIVSGLLLVAARGIIDERISVEVVLLSLGALAAAGSKLRVLSGLVNDLQGADATARRLLETMESPVEVDRPGAQPLPRHRTSVAFEGVRLTYPGATTPAVDGIDLQIEHGQRVAIVGPNGCGKSTLLSMLPRLLQPDDGRITIDGQDIAGVTVASLRDQVSVVTQDTVLFRGTIAENIRLGRSDADDAAVIEAARCARAHEFIERLPKGYETDVAEQGTSLSGGQRQRLCIARAILRDPSILILDEATSQIDAESEALITEALNEFCDDRTVLVIAHRLATVLDADRIVVMEEGRIVDEGTHETLIERCPLYARLSRTQLVAGAP